MTRGCYLSVVCNCKISFDGYREYLDYWAAIKALNKSGDYSKGYATSDASGNTYIDYTDLIDEAYNKGIILD